SNFSGFAVVQPDEKIVGIFGERTGAAFTVRRLNPDGSPDADFAEAALSMVSLYPFGESFLFAIQNDGKILIQGIFNRINGQTCSGLVRLNTNGAPDTGFTPPPSNGLSTYLLLRRNGKILIQNDNGLTQLNQDGSPDAGNTLAKANTVPKIELPNGELL